MGKSYKGAVCHAVLCEPTDAYEWSFVAVPAQRGAGVTKAFTLQTREELDTQQLLKSLQAAQEGISLNAEQARQLLDYLQTAKQAQQEAAAYREELLQETVDMLPGLLPALSEHTGRALCANLSAAQLKQLQTALCTKSMQLPAKTPQLRVLPGGRGQNHDAFKI